MPREQIIFPRVVETPSEVTDSKTALPNRAAAPFPIPHVTWNSQGEQGAGWIQLMFDVDRQFLEDLMKDLPADQNYVEIYSEVLSRDDANRLIRAGRRARDNTYGRDE